MMRAPVRMMREADIGLPVDPEREAFREAVRRETMDAVIYAVHQRQQSHRIFPLKGATLERYNEGDCIQRILYRMRSDEK